MGAITGDLCVKACVEEKQRDGSINGVTMYDDGQLGCFCEKNMNRVDTKNRHFKTCFFKSKGFSFDN